MNRYGYVLQPATPYNRRREYQHLHLEIYVRYEAFKGAYRWERLLDISWQSDRDNGRWYGFEIRFKVGLSITDFEIAMTFLNRMKKDQMYKSSPEELVVWLALLRGSERLVRDERLGCEVTLNEYEETKHLTAFKFYIGAKYVDNLLAVSEGHAWELALEKCTSNGYCGYRGYLESYPDNWRFEMTYHNEVDHLLFDEWVAILWN
jgi:hypothetical protein